MNEVIFDFDTTGSMYPALTQVRRDVVGTVRGMFARVPNLRIGVIVHGDYCDSRIRGSYVTKKLDLTTNERAIVDFVNNVGATDGGDSEECYELVMREAQGFSWSAGSTRALVMIGDETPHSPGEAQNYLHLDWRVELRSLLAAGIHVYAVQALGRRHATSFYKEVARITGGFHLQLNQFAEVADTLMAICLNQGGQTEELGRFRDEVRAAGRYNRDMAGIFTTLGGTPAAAATEFAPVAGGLRPVHPGRFQVLNVDHDQQIKEFVAAQGLRFKTKRGFYEFIKTVTVQDYKEVILMDRETGDMFTGSDARRLLGLPEHGTVNINPRSTAGLRYVAFIQSASHTRKLIGGTRFLYEVEDWTETV